MRKKDRLLALCLAAAILAGVLLCAGLWQKRVRLQREVAETVEASAASEAAWNATNDAKVPLLDQAKALREQIREAEVQKETSEAKVETLTAQLEELAQERAAAEAALAEAQARLQAAQDTAAALDAGTAALTDAADTLRAALEAGEPQPIKDALEAARRALDGASAD